MANLSKQSKQWLREMAGLDGEEDPASTGSLEGTGDFQAPVNSVDGDVGNNDGELSGAIAEFLTSISGWEWYSVSSVIERLLLDLPPEKALEFIRDREL